KMHRGHPVDIEEVGLIQAFQAPPNPKAKLRPAQPGSSIGFQFPPPNPQRLVMAETFGALVQDAQSKYVLSNNHVLADENKLPAGARIYQPGLLDNGQVPADQIARLTRFIPLMTGDNQVDCAIAALTSPNIANSSILAIGPPKGANAAAVDMVVHK